MQVQCRAFRLNVPTELPSILLEGQIRGRKYIVKNNAPCAKGKKKPTSLERVILDDDFALVLCDNTRANCQNMPSHFLFLQVSGFLYRFGSLFVDRFVRSYLLIFFSPFLPFCLSVCLFVCL